MGDKTYKYTVCKIALDKDFTEERLAALVWVRKDFTEDEVPQLTLRGNLNEMNSEEEETYTCKETGAVSVA